MNLFGMFFILFGGLFVSVEYVQLLFVKWMKCTLMGMHSQAIHYRLQESTDHKVGKFLVSTISIVHTHQDQNSKPTQHIVWSYYLYLLPIISSVTCSNLWWDDDDGAML